MQTFSRENAETTCQNMEKKKKNMRAIFQHFQSMKLKQRKNTNLFCWYTNTQQ